jgi:hypothetical protein
VFDKSTFYVVSPPWRLALKFLKTHPAKIPKMPENIEDSCENNLV